MIRWPLTIATPVLAVLALLGMVVWVIPVVTGEVAVILWIINHSIENDIPTPWG